MAKRRPVLSRRKNHIQDIRAISVVEIFMNDRRGCTMRLPFIPEGGLDRGQKACFTKQEIRAESAKRKENERRMAVEWKMNRKRDGQRGLSDVSIS